MIFKQDDAQKAYIAIVDELVAAEAKESAAAAADAGPGKQYDGLKITRENKIFKIQLNRPNKKNAITYEVSHKTSNNMNMLENMLFIKCFKHTFHIGFCVFHIQIILSGVANLSRVAIFIIQFLLTNKSSDRTCSQGKKISNQADKKFLGRRIQLDFMIY